jgi:hypothetical protein
VASRRTPPKLDASTLLHPTGASIGLLDVLAQKKMGVTLKSARQYASSSDEYEKVINGLQEALKRDWIFMKVADAFRSPKSGAIWQYIWSKAKGWPFALALDRYVTRGLLRVISLFPFNPKTYG